MKAKTWNVVVLTSVCAVLAVIAICTIIVDPFLHYHSPLKGMEYPLKDERYQNDGIARWYDYDAIITGSSMVQNFKPSEFDELMGVKSIKIAFSGATYFELHNNIDRALGYNPNVKKILCGIDPNRLLMKADQNEYEGYPEYFYDENPFNDVNYLLNKEVVPKTIAVINYTRAGERTPTMDQYGSWSHYKTFGRDAVFATLEELPEFDEERVFSEEELATIEENVVKNIVDLARENPEVEFYLFYPPYSICFWEALYNTKQLSAQISAEKLATELLVEVPNIYLYGYADKIDIVSNLDNYTDSLHYSGEINSEILHMIARDEGRLTVENYEEYYENLKKIYESFNYSILRQ